MLERIRLLLNRPLDPRVARAVLALGGAAVIGYAIVATLAGLGADRSESARPVSHRPESRTLAPAPARRVRPRQDPQDDPVSAAARRSRRELREHAALQHVPYRRGRFSVLLVGARHGRAVLRVSAPTLSLARSGWRSFLRRFADPGTSYIPTFRATGRTNRPYEPVADQPDGRGDGLPDGTTSHPRAAIRHLMSVCGDPIPPTFLRLSGVNS